MARTGGTVWLCWVSASSTRGSATAAEGEVGERADEVHERGRRPQPLASPDLGAGTVPQVNQRGHRQRHLDHASEDDRSPLAAAELAPTLASHGAPPSQGA